MSSGPQQEWLFLRLARPIMYEWSIRGQPRLSQMRALQAGGRELDRNLWQ